MFTANANGLKNKLHSLKSHIKNLNIRIFTIQESMFCKRGKIDVEGFELFEAIRKKDGGGTVLGAHKGLDPILINEYSDNFELIFIEIRVGGKFIRVISGYGPQESWGIDIKMPFLMSLEEEIKKQNSQEDPSYYASMQTLKWAPNTSQMTYM